MQKWFEYRNRRFLTEISRFQTGTATSIHCNCKGMKLLDKEIEILRFRELSKLDNDNAITSSGSVNVSGYIMDERKT